MVKKDKDEFERIKYNQNLKSYKFVKDFTEWKKNCLGISGSDLFVENIPTLYDFLDTHIVPSGANKNVRDQSVNAGKDEGVKGFLSFISNALADGKFTFGEAMIISGFAETLSDMKGTELDPALIVFTDIEMKGGKKVGTSEVLGHYRTDNYEKRTGKPAAPVSWLAGENPPHQALYAESGKYAKPTGLVYIMKEAKDMIKGSELTEVEIPFSDSDFEQADKISVISDYFDKAIKNSSFWTEGGMLRVNILRRDFRNTNFGRIKRKDQQLLAEISGLNRGGKRKKEAPVGEITEFTPLDATAGALIELIDKALIRAGKNTAPNGYRAWQNQRKKGFDYRKTAKEVYGTKERPKSGKGSRTQMKPTQRVISKMWQSLLWR